MLLEYHEIISCAFLTGVCPDKEMVDLLKKRFGEKGGPLRKVYRQLYWFPKFKNASPWPVPWPPIFDRFALAKLAIERIVSVDPQSVVTVFEVSGDTFLSFVELVYYLLITFLIFFFLTD